jgi:Xaa-Pro aminopeptidase
MMKSRLTKLKDFFSFYNIDGYIVPKNDAYFSEFSSPDRLKTISNFSGSAGHAIILKKKNYLFVDGRYTIQAELESGKEYRILEIPKFSHEFIFNKYKKKLRLGYDPQLFTGLYINNKLSNYFELLSINDNLIDKVHKKPTKVSVTPFYGLNSKIAGESINSKINKVINQLKKFKIDNIFISAPENVAWLLNLRGKDNPHAPIPNSKLFLTKNKKIYFFSCPKKILKMKKISNYKDIKYYQYKDFSKVIKKLKGNFFSIDKNTCSISNENSIKSLFKIKLTTDPCYKLKSIKNKIEIKNMINAHIKDGVALTKFIYWIKKINKKKITEYEAQNKLERFRKKNKNYLYPSFNTIAGSGGNAAIVHYRSTKLNTKKINKNDIFLCDSGGQYKYGTTDVTRTLCFSRPKKNIKNIFTKVLKGHIAVACTNININKTGKSIDIRARKFLKKANLDYAHGTGHGVGFFSNVHEGPQAISKYNKVKISEGMILSNEPGYYRKEKFGIRIENLLYVKKSGHKLFFENLTLAPIDYDLIDFKQLSKNEKKYLFKYNMDVYSKLSPFLSKNEKQWLTSFI